MTETLVDLTMVVRVGLAMLQGARHEHAQAIHGAALELGVEIEVIPLRKSEDVVAIDLLILPGGESTTMRKAADDEGLLSALFEWMSKSVDRPVLATCAGAILMVEPGLGHESFIDARISRNAWGRQAESFQVDLDIEVEEQVIRSVVQPPVQTEEVHHPLTVSPHKEPDDGARFPGVFIRAPRFDSIGDDSEVLASLDGEAVGIREGGRIALTFHPELTLDRRFHRMALRAAAAQSLD